MVYMLDILGLWYAGYIMCAVMCVGVECSRDGNKRIYAEQCIELNSLAMTKNLAYFLMYVGKPDIVEV